MAAVRLFPSTEEGEAEEGTGKTREASGTGKVEGGDGGEGDREGGSEWKWSDAWRFCGPGLVVATALIDPGNVAGDAQLGSSSGNRLLWVLLYSTALGTAFQLLSMRLGVASGKSLAELVGQRYHSIPRYLSWLLLHSTVIGADVQEMLGSAIGLSILTSGRLAPVFGVLLTSLNTFIFLAFEDTIGYRSLEAVFGLLIFILASAFFSIFATAGVDWGSVLHGIAVPLLPLSDVQVAAGMVGAVIMPYNVFLHSTIVQSRIVKQEDRGHTSCDPTLSETHSIRTVYRYFCVESSVALGASFLVNFIITSVFAKGFFNSSASDECSDGDISLINGGTCLEERFGRNSILPLGVVWGLGLFASGQSSALACTMAGQSLFMGYLKLEKLSLLKRVAITRGSSIIPALVASVFLTSPDGVRNAYLWLNILQTLMLPFAIFPLLHYLRDDRICGDYVLNRISAVICWTFAMLLVVMNTGLFFAGINFTPLSTVLVAIGSVPYFLLCVYACIGSEGVDALALFFKRKARTSEEQPLLNHCA